MIAYENNKDVTVFHESSEKLSVFWGVEKIYPDEEPEPYTITMTPDGWTGPITYFDQVNGCLIAANPTSKCGIYIRGYVISNNNGWAQFGYEKTFDTHGLKYVDITIPYSNGIYTESGTNNKLGGDILINGAIAIGARTTIPATNLIVTKPITGDTIKVTIKANSFGKTNIYSYNKLQSLYFHN